MYNNNNNMMYLERLAARGARVDRESKPLSLSSERRRGGGTANINTHDHLPVPSPLPRCIIYIMYCR